MGDCPFVVSYLAGGRFDSPHMPLLTEPLIKGYPLIVNAIRLYEVRFSFPFDVELLSIAVTSRPFLAEDDDYWELSIDGKKNMQTIYIKELPESINMGNHWGVVRPIVANTLLNFFYNSTKADSRRILFNIKTLTNIDNLSVVIPDPIYL